ncbi:MAG: hypothetical protein LBI79_06265 [Nitrososphaerota archaeon]|jgi:hypothetical protein|nr:hypothetical protein [Nitrososphaerota archaeon]
MDKKVVIDPMTIPQQIIKLAGPEKPITAQPTAARAIYVSRVVSTGGTVSMPNNFLGPLDQFHVWLYGTSTNAGVIIGEMSAHVPAGSSVRVKAFSGGSVANTSIMEVFVSNSSGGSWVQVLNVTVPQVPVSTYTFNAPTGGFQYIAVRGHNNSNYSDLYVDGAESP